MGKSTKSKEDFTYDKARALITEELHPWLNRVVMNYNRSNQMAKKLEIVETLPVASQQMDLLLANQRDINEALSGWRDLQLNLKSDLSRIFQPLKKVKRFSIQSIQLLSEVFLKEYRTAINLAYNTNDFDWLSDEDLDYLARVATSIYIERWLEKDRSSRKTIYAFSKYGYKDKKDSKQEVIADDKEKLNKLYRAYDKYNELFVLRQRQAKEDHESMPVAPYKRNNKASLDLVTLSWCNAWANGYLKLLEFWLYRKHFINRKSKRDTNQNEKLCDILGQYNEMLSEINFAQTQTEKDTIKNIEYVANCILVQKIERVYRFQLISEIAKYCQKFELELSDFDTTIFAAYFGRYSKIDGLLFDSINVFDSDGNRKYIRSNDPLGVLNYNKIIDTIAHTHEPEKIYAEAHKEMMRRCALMDLLTLMYAIFPVDQQHSWKITDYKDAADFYHESYPVISSYLGDESSDLNNATSLTPDAYAASMDEREKAHRFYDLFHEFYMLIYNMEDSPLKVALDELTAKKRPTVEF